MIPFLLGGAVKSKGSFCLQYVLVYNYLKLDVSSCLFVSPIFLLPRLGSTLFQLQST